MSIRDLAAAATCTGDEVRVAVNVATHAEAVLREVGDDDGARQASTIRDRLRHPTVTLVVAGEYQQGKSSLINALLGARLMPTEPLATTSTPIRVAWARQATSQALVAAPEGAGAAPQRCAIDLDRLADLATTERPRLEDRLVVGLEVSLDHPLLRSGISLVDTPCVSGGLATRTAGLVLGLLQDADGLIFVTDASQELTGPELEFLRMAHTLCPSLLVVLSKIDLYLDWRRILDIDQAYLAAIAPEASVLPASPQLRGAAVRWADLELDRASGLPLIGWYLGTTLLTAARQVAVARAGAALSARLGATGTFVAEQVAVLERSTGYHRVDQQHREATARLEMLRLEAPKRVRLALRAFTRVTSADLTNRFAGVNDMVADLVRRVDPADQWSEIEASLHRATNRALAEHLTFVRARAETVIAELGELLGLAPEALADQSGHADSPAIPPGAEPDIDDPDFSSVRVTRVHDAVRGAVSSGFMGLGLATMILAGGVAPLALGAGASLSTMLLTLRRERTRDLETRRAKALQACRSWIAESRSALGAYADDLYKELEFQLENRIEKQLQALLTQADAERARLDALRRVAAERVPEEVTRARAQLERVRLVHAHARRLEHRLARPDLQAATQ